MMSAIRVVKTNRPGRPAPTVSGAQSYARTAPAMSQLQSDWYERMSEAAHVLRRRIWEQKWRLREAFNAAEEEQMFARINLERKLPREVWMLLLWDSELSHSYTEFRDELSDQRTVVLRKTIERLPGETNEWARLQLGRGGEDVYWYLEGDRLLAQEDRAVWAWTLLLAGVSPAEMEALTEGSLPVR